MTSHPTHPTTAAHHETRPDREARPDRKARLARRLVPVLAIASLPATLLAGAPATASKGGATAQRTVYADVVAINQPLVYNRFGSVNPWGMIYALRSDVDGCARAPDRPGGVEDQAKCSPGRAMLKPGVRPRPLVLRVAEGDRLVVRFQNLLMPMPSASRSLDENAVGGVPLPPALTKVQRIAEVEPPAKPGGAATVTFETSDPRTIPDPPNDPMTRLAAIAVVGLRSEGGSPGATGLVGVAPGDSAEYSYIADRKGSYFFSSLAAVQGGEGDGGSLTHGLFGMVLVEPRGARAYRSQVSAADMACVRNLPGKGDGCENSGSAGAFNYEASRNGKPVLAMHQVSTDGSHAIIHGDLTAIIVPEGGRDRKACRPPASGNDKGVGKMDDWHRPADCPYREFAIMFHDELKTVHAPDYAILNGPTLDPNLPNDNMDRAAARHKQLVGTRDGFAINYGASGMGTALISNRAGVGPARNCVDCAYEEFFLQSWANGDPALLPQYGNDPSNVYHSYLGDPVEFHNVHAGPKETHVFHLHAHQWLSQEANSASNYLDSQTIGPFQTFTYQIEYGGSGNRNLGPGDSIFHCHLYPHFAQGMWGLWRTHDVFEDGTRLLPDGGGLTPVPGTDLTEWQGPGTDPVTGAGQLTAHGGGLFTGGTPIPALVPLPKMPLAPQPTYAANGMPGYPFYIPGKPGFRAPQPPLDMAKDGGLPRHVTKEGVRKTTANGGLMNVKSTATTLLNRGLEEGDLTFHIEQVAIDLLPADGTPLEKAAMAFHAQKQTAGGFRLNGRPPAAGSPFGNPCPAGSPEIRYNASAIELSLLVNRYGWHDPQARINVLDSDLDKFQWNVARSQRTPRPADPFFFRVHSGDCVTFQHTNRTAAKTGQDAFQVAAPTDIIGQHIHLVKFDVTASDGSANGFNYEDGTLAKDMIGELIHASQGRVRGIDGATATLSVPAEEEARYQATLQRWWADPRYDRKGRDQTLGTVFTHDHFGPSNIQQHGFYNALLVEPRGSKWLNPDGTPMPKRGADGLGAAVGTQAIIQTPKSARAPDHLTGNRREFAVAVADFALLYDGSGEARAIDGSRQANLIDEYPILESGPKRYAAKGRPIAPPEKPESISVDHHDPYMFNYKLEPIPLRLGSYSDRWRQYEGLRGDAAYVFNSQVHRQNGGARSDALDRIDPRRNHADGDPSTEIFEGYVGDRVIMRMIQGAQEVQHVFEINGLNWRRQPGDPASPLVASQEIGISEHFEFGLDSPLTGRDVRPGQPVDFRYSAGTIDAQWNGAWGLFRTYPSLTAALDPGTSDYWQALLGGGGGRPVNCRLATVKGDLLSGGPCAAAAETVTPGGVDRPIPIGTSTILRGQMVPDLSAVSGMRTFVLRKFCVEAVSGRQTYNAREQIFDPIALRYRLTNWSNPNGPNGMPSGTVISKETLQNRDLQDIAQQMQCEPVAAAAGPDDMAKPLVLRMNDGDFAIVELRTTNLPERTLSASQDNAVLPSIAPSSRNAPAVSDPDLANRLKPSARIGLTPQLVSTDARTGLGVSVGLNALAAGGSDDDIRFPGYAHASMPDGQAASALWFAGNFKTLMKKRAPRGFKTFAPFGTQHGMVAALTSLADPIKHPAMGLVGALVIEPVGATWRADPGDPTRAEITLPNGQRYEEAVLVYQDGLNLKTYEGLHGVRTVVARGPEVAIPDCIVCDDTYDSGDIAVNYRTEPFWARTNQKVRDGNNPESGRPSLVNLNSVSIPADIWTRPVARPGGSAAGGQRVETPVITVPEGSRLVIHAVHPGGRARQRALITYGHRYDDLSLAKFGSPNSALLAPRKATTAVIDRVEPGCWLWRDGPAQMVGGGAWGFIETRAPGSAPGSPGSCPIRE